jgi:hypothetical protein
MATKVAKQENDVQREKEMALLRPALTTQLNDIVNKASLAVGPKGAPRGRNRCMVNDQPRTANMPTPHTHDPPFDDIEGKWVPRKQFKGRESFGRYRCHACKKSWTSAHAFKWYRQGCKDCNKRFLPCCMWVNAKPHRQREHKHDSDSTTTKKDKPHDKSRCDACDAKKCTSNK